MHPSELLDPGDRALFTFTERTPHGPRQSRWYFGVSYHVYDGHTPHLQNPFHDNHAWIIYEYLPFINRSIPWQPRSEPPPMSIAIYRPIFIDYNQPYAIGNLNVLLPPSINPPPLGVTTQVIRDRWMASFHLLTHLDDDEWEWVRDRLLRNFLTGRSRVATAGIVQDGQDFITMVLVEGMSQRGSVSDEEYREWWDSVEMHWKGFRTVDGFEG
ncbi:hypothetical protein B0T09DRAFT_389650 [Sordaria sp. MPI-SDFR-AT-0083]|nr:hypothetical protein B0T09DRAFT_389650 [Sordaria sp. MPI-SDFR-AT-0083]